MEDSTNLIVEHTHWYRKWWGVLLIFILTVFVLMVAAVVFYSVDTYNKLKSGELNFQAMNFDRQKPYSFEEVTNISDPLLGDKNAPITIVEYGDFLCSRTQASLPVLRDLIKNNPKTVKLYWRHLPMVANESVLLAKAGECAHRQNRFWPYHDKLLLLAPSFTVQNLTVERLVDLAGEFGMNTENFSTCLNDAGTMYKLYEDAEAGETLSLDGTPTFFVNGYKIVGFISLENWQEIIDKLSNQN